MNYHAREIRQQLARGSYPGEDFYRLKVTGLRETRWLNITHEQLERIAAMLDEVGEDV